MAEEEKADDGLELLDLGSGSGGRRGRGNGKRRRSQAQGEGQSLLTDVALNWMGTASYQPIPF